MNKCKICRVYVECYNKPKACAWDHNGDKAICPLSDEYIDTSLYDKQIRADAIDEFVKFANTMPTVEENDGEIRPMWLEEMAEQLKGED